MTSFDDDITGQYTNSRQEANSEALKSWASQFDDPAPVQQPAPVAEDDPVTADDVAKDVIRGGVELVSGKVLASGLSKAANETFQFAGDVGDWLNENVVDLGTIQLQDPEIGEFDLDFVSSEEFNRRMNEAGVRISCLPWRLRASRAALHPVLCSFLQALPELGRFED